MRENVAIIGSGIAGMGTAWFLHPHHEITLFDRNAHTGGHSNTVEVTEDGRQLPLDTGFMVFNKVTYPRLTRLFELLDVPVKRTNMSFSAQHLPAGLEYTGSLAGLFAQKRNLVRPGVWRMIGDIRRFDREAARMMNEPGFETVTLQEFIDQQGYGREFLEWFLIPMGSAVWSTPWDLMLEFPALTLIRFFHNHSFIANQHPWWTVDGGSREYVKRMTAPFADRIHQNAPVRAVHREGDKVRVRLEDDREETFDRVVLASHADESLAILGDADAEERDILSAFHYQKNLATVHTDSSVMPKHRKVWAAWNYRITETGHCTIYWMNRLQGVSEHQNYYVSIDGRELIDPAKIIYEMEYTHPLFSLPAIQNQAKLPGLNRREGARVHFCGSYYRYGFHEDGFLGAEDVCQHLLRGDPWPKP